MTSDETIAAVHDGNPMTAIEGAPAEWDDDTLALLKDEGPVAWPDEDGPRTTSELVVVPGYTQTEWDRQQVRKLQAALAAEVYLWENLHKTDEVLVRDLLLLLGFDRAARAWMSTGFVAGSVFGSMTAAPEKPKRKRPSQARKAVNGGT